MEEEYTLAVENFSKTMNQIDLLKLHEIVNNLVSSKLARFNGFDTNIMSDVSVTVFNEVIKNIAERNLTKITYSKIRNRVDDILKVVYNSNKDLILNESYETTKSRNVFFKIVEFFSSLTKSEQITLALFLSLEDRCKMFNEKTLIVYNKFLKHMDVSHHEFNTEYNWVFKYVFILKELEKYGMIVKYIFILVGLNNFNLLCLLNTYSNSKLPLPTIFEFNNIIDKYYNSSNIKYDINLMKEFSGSYEEFLLNKYTETLLSKLDIFFERVDYNTISSHEWLDKITNTMNFLKNSISSSIHDLSKLVDD